MALIYLSVKTCISSSVTAPVLPSNADLNQATLSTAACQSLDSTIDSVNTVYLVRSGSSIYQASKFLLSSTGTSKSLGISTVHMKACRFPSTLFRDLLLHLIECSGHFSAQMSMPTSVAKDVSGSPSCDRKVDCRCSIKNILRGVRSGCAPRMWLKMWLRGRRVSQRTASAFRRDDGHIDGHSC
jgi:hypothetical protein